MPRPPRRPSTRAVGGSRATSRRGSSRTGPTRRWPDNPIHSDPESARRAGLRKPIAGGSHVQAFALEPILARFGPEVLLWGAHVDTRWKAPVEADATITPRVVVELVAADRVELAFEVRLADERVACAGRVTIPRPA